MSKNKSKKSNFQKNKSVAIKSKQLKPKKLVINKNIKNKLSDVSKDTIHKDKSFQKSVPDKKSSTTNNLKGKLSLNSNKNIKIGNVKEKHETIDVIPIVNKISVKKPKVSAVIESDNSDIDDVDLLDSEEGSGLEGNVSGESSDSSDEEKVIKIDKSSTIQSVKQNIKTASNEKIKEVTNSDTAKNLEVSKYTKKIEKGKEANKNLKLQNMVDHLDSEDDSDIDDSDIEITDDSDIEITDDSDIEIVDDSDIDVCDMDEDSDASDDVTENTNKIEASKSAKEATAAKKSKEIEASKKAKEVEVAKKGKEVEVAKKGKEVEVAKKGKEVEVAKKGKEVEVAKKGKEVEATKKGKEVEAAKKGKDVEAAKKGKEVEAAKKGKEVEATKKGKDVEAAKKGKEVEAAKKDKIDQELNVIDPSTKSGKILIEINNRRELIAASTIHVGNIPKDAKSFEITKNLENVVNIDLPKNKKSKEHHRGYGFIRFANPQEAEKAMSILNKTTLSDKLLAAHKYICTKVADDISHVDLTRILLTSFKFKEVTQSIEAHFSTGVTVKRINIVTHELTFKNKGEAIALFNRKNVTINGLDFLANFVIDIHEKYDNTTIPEATVSTEVSTAKKRINSASNNEVVTKKLKIAQPQIPKKVVQVVAVEKSNKADKKEAAVNNIEMPQVKNVSGQSGDAVKFNNKVKQEIVSKKAKVSLSQEVKNPKNNIPNNVTNKSEKMKKKKKKHSHKKEITN